MTTNSSGNPLTALVQSPSLVNFTDDQIFVDGVYPLAEVADRIATLSGAQADPRFYGSGQAPRQTRASSGGGQFLTAAAQADPASTRKEIYRVTFEGLEPFNKMTFQLLNVPCNFEVWYLDTSSKRYRPLTDAAGHQVHGRIPKRGRHPHHGQRNPAPRGTWVDFSFRFPTTVSKEVELRLDRRIPLSEAPDLSPAVRQTQAYRLGIRRLAFHLNVCVRDDAPPKEIPFGIRTPLGFVERLYVKDYDASRAIDGGDTTYWLSGPSPYSYSVVPFFLDLTDTYGARQRIDRIKAVPIEPGPTMNLYWSDDETIGAFEASRRTTVLNGIGAAIVDPTLDFSVTPAPQIMGGVSCSSVADYLAMLDTELTKIDLTIDRSFCMGALVKPNFNALDHTNDLRRYIVDVASHNVFAIGIAYRTHTDTTAGQWELLLNDGSGDRIMAAVTGPVFSSGDVVAVAGGIDATTGTAWMMAATPGDTTSAESATASVTNAYSSDQRQLADEFYIGISSTYHDGQRHSALSSVSRVWFKQDAPRFESFLAFAMRPDEFIDGRGPMDPANGAYNALLLAPLMSDLTVRIGPGDGYYDQKSWNPMQRDFILRSGFLPIPPTNARYLKMEFSDLIGRPYTVPKGCTLIHRDYPTWVKKWHDDLPQAQDQRPAPPSLSQEGSVQSGGAIAPPSKLVMPGLDETRAAIESGAYMIINPVKHDAPGDNPLPTSRKRYRFFRAGMHQYVEQRVEMVTQEAFFVGLKEVGAYRTLYPMES